MSHFFSLISIFQKLVNYGFIRERRNLVSALECVEINLRISNPFNHLQNIKRQYRVSQTGVVDN